eukprot:superscaffoldBa00000465_g4927
MYNYSISPNREWKEARKWCQQHFTDMVIIQNQEETDFLNSMLPSHRSYYWAGILNKTGEWIWVGTNKIVSEEEQNWAPGEPNLVASDHCVEIYIKRTDDTAKWNNADCKKRKGTVCYTVSCKQDSCSAHADCVETIGNYTCRCHPGFQGPRCEEGAPQLLCQASGRWDHPVPLCQVQQCPVLNNTSGGNMNCSHPIAPYSYNSTCEFRCDEGYGLSGHDHTQCDHTGQWTASVPTCTVKKCSPIIFPVPGNMTCVDTVEPFSYGSGCNFTCQEGFYLTGENTITCLANGQWSKPTPACKAVQCNSLKAPPHGTMQCQDPLSVYSYGSVCTVQCEEGFDLIGTNMTKCLSQGNWSHALPVCQAKKCLALNSPAHGSLACVDPHGVFSFGSQCNSTCEQGFVMNGTAETECTSVGTWSTEIPRCLARPCPLLAKAPQHGSMNCSHAYSPFSYGSHCDFECNRGFWMRGTSAMTCNTSGHWSQNLPTCQPVQCETIRALSLPLSMKCSHPLGNFSFGSECLFTCKEGYLLNGTGVLFCSSTGFWSDTLPTCTEEGMPVGAAMLMYTGVGAAAAVVPLALIGLALLIRRQFKKRGNKNISDVPTWEERDNPAFEF